MQPRYHNALDEAMATVVGPSLDDLLMEVAADLESPEQWVETGFKKLDHYLDGGIRPGEVMLIAARPSVGKSAFALQLALHMATNGVPVSVWSLEMRPKQWVRRGIAGISGVPLGNIRKGMKHLTDNDLLDINTTMSVLHGKPLHFVPEDSDTTPDGFRLQAQEEVEGKGSKVLLIDYLQLMQAPAMSHSREQEVAQISRQMKLTANRLGVSIIALAQLNRDAQGRVPDLSDLRESGALEQDADIVTFLHRDIDKDTNLLKDSGLVLVGKNRDGRTGGVPARYNWKRFAFEELNAA